MKMIEKDKEDKIYKCCFCGKEYNNSNKETFVINWKDGHSSNINTLQIMNKHLRACSCCIKAFVNGYLYNSYYHDLRENINMELEFEEYEQDKENTKIKMEEKNDN